MKHIEATRWDVAPIAAGAAASAAVDDLGYLDPRPARNAPGLGERLLTAFGIWLERARARGALARVPSRDLRDAGLSIEAVGHELGRPFWRPLDRERK